jgi:chemotaxis protein MotB
MAQRGKASGSAIASRRDRRRSGGGDDDRNRWLGTYGDAVTLLMAFFVMLYAMAELDVVKFNAFVQGLEGPFGNPAAADMLDALPAIVGDAGAHQPTTDLGAVTTPPYPDLPPIQEALEQQQRSQAALEQLEAVQSDVIIALESAGVADVASFTFERRGLVISISADDVLFATGSAELSGRGREVIRAVTTPLLGAPNEVLVEGHTDDVPLRRAGYTNWNLSTDRAISVLTMMFADLGFPQERLGAAGYGEFRPRVPNTDPAARAVNRRVDIVVATLMEGPR